MMPASSTKTGRVGFFDMLRWGCGKGVVVRERAESILSVLLLDSNVQDVSESEELSSSLVDLFGRSDSSAMKLTTSSKAHCEASRWHSPKPTLLSRRVSMVR